MENPTQRLINRCAGFSLFGLPIGVSLMGEAVESFFAKLTRRRLQRGVFWRGA